MMAILKWVLFLSIVEMFCWTTTIKVLNILFTECINPTVDKPASWCLLATTEIVFVVTQYFDND